MAFLVRHIVFTINKNVSFLGEETKFSDCAMLRTVGPWPMTESADLGSAAIQIKKNK